MAKQTTTKSFSRSQKNLHKTWEELKMIVNIKKPHREKGRRNRSGYIKSNFFSTTAQKVESKLINTRKHYTDYLTESLQQIFSF